MYKERTKTNTKSALKLVAPPNRSRDAPSCIKLEMKPALDCGLQLHHEIPKGIFQLIYLTSTDKFIYNF